MNSRNPWALVATVLLIGIPLIFPGCAHAPAGKVSERAPAMAYEGLADHREIYRYRGLLKAPPLRHLLVFVAEKGLKIYLKRLPLDPEVRARLNANLESEKFSKFFVPFVLAMKDLYVASKKAKKYDFKRYVHQNFPDPRAIPGLEHSLFQYEKSELESAGDAIEGDEGEETGESAPAIEPKADHSHEAAMIAGVITILDAVLLQNSEFTLESQPLRLEKTVDLAVPPTKVIMEGLLSSTDPQSPSYPAIEAMTNSPARVRATAAVLIDVIHYFAYKHYQMFAGRYQAKVDLRERLSKAFAAHPKLLATALTKELGERKFGAQILVDGLEGHLVESLVVGKSSSPFLQSTQDERRNWENNRPKSIPYRILPDTQNRFIDSFMAKGGFSHPAYLKFFKGLYAEYGNSIARSGNSTTPTISARNIPILQTGAPVEGKGATHIVNMHFINRTEDRAYYFFGNDAFLQPSISSRGGMKTLAERFPKIDSLNCMGTFEAGYRWSIDTVLNIALGEKIRDFGEILCMREFQRRGKNEKKLGRLKERFAKLVTEGSARNARKEKLLDQIADLQNESMPQLVTYFYPWVDHFAHFKGPMSDEILAPSGELNRLDYWLGRLKKIYQDAGVYDRTLFVMAGDHGLTPVRYLLNPEKAVFGKMIEEGTEIKLNKISSDEGEGPKITDPAHPPSQHGYDVVVASTAGGNYMVDLFLDQGANWVRQPVYEEITHYRLLNGSVIDVVGESLRRLDDTLDYLAVRETKCGVDGGAVRAVGLRKGARVDAVITRAGHRIFYDSAGDLLQVRVSSPYSVEPITVSERRVHEHLVAKCVDNPRKEDSSTWCTEDEWRDLASYTPRPDSVVQLARLYDIESAGTMNLFPSPYIGYNSIVPGRHAGELFMEKDAFVGYWGAHPSPNSRIRSAVNGSITPTLYEYLSGKASGGAANGWGYRSLFEN